MATEEYQSLVGHPNENHSNVIGDSIQYEDPRLDYSKKIWRDVWCGVVYYAALLAVLIYTIYLWADDGSEIEGTLSPTPTVSMTFPLKLMNNKSHVIKVTKFNHNN